MTKRSIISTFLDKIIFKKEIKMNDNNVTQTQEIIEKLDINFFPQVQNWLNHLYQIEEVSFFSELYFNIPLANILAAIFSLLFFLTLRKLFATLAIKVLQPLTTRTQTYYDDRILSALKGPLTFVFVIIGVRLFFALLFIETTFIAQLIDAMLVYNLFWAIFALTHALRGAIYHFTKSFNPELAHEMGNFILTIIRGIVLFIGLGAVLQVWGINVGGLVAGLGIGGLAFALAAKDTAANLFGSIALLLDKSIRIGEWIKIGSVEGTVEDIGMRTTKIRSFGKSLITLPNQVIANSPIENFSRRGVRRIKMTIGLTYSTTSPQMKKILNDIKTMLRNHEGIAQKETMLVNFTAFNDSSLDIFIYTFSNTANWAKYMEIKEEVNLEIMKIIEDNNSDFAFPSQSLYVENLPNINQ
ncbi:MAG: Potassium efflux system KefA protein / Small-conductance mechanosensitive channel [uncultured Sulfurovum sp.]|uniref:Potassium efflux system KefA protein / Small-conductance mechanosensitive channel n=1 Tax=uncultured Sulfurovum sp. TaxID=269237 RepID=A0A6S6T591_9BACT|nr:MAG: Potassium efflux system KefA protein / Small-conductance mechanosensitive channel [uncultured Sulfurovum sp.]